VIGVVERESGEIRLEVCRDATRQTCESVIFKHVAEGTMMYTDGWCGYEELYLHDYRHKVVIHSKGEYARDDDGDGFHEVHCNTMEGIWSLLRQWIRTFRGVRKDRLHLYVNAFQFFYNFNKWAENNLECLLKWILPIHP
jgi:transposase-like protein